ncbi:MAG: zf-HC2 domain-containing protein [Gemmatimonadaceae bacterium]|jgi:anti-sigma factor (TIGR02949 family)|nr:zf-HC2 domain-containing protein [Gemmatimonadaceae bacterium]
MMRDGFDCDEAMRRLWDYLDGELDAARDAEMRAHLAACGHCSGHADFERHFLAAVRAVPALPGADPTLRQRVVASLVAAGMPAGTLPSADRELGGGA